MRTFTARIIATALVAVIVGFALSATSALAGPGYQGPNSPVTRGCVTVSNATVTEHKFVGTRRPAIHYTRNVTTTVEDCRGYTKTVIIATDWKLAKYVPGTPGVR